MTITMTMTMTMTMNRFLAQINLNLSDTGDAVHADMWIGGRQRLGQVTASISIHSMNINPLNITG